MIYLLYSKDYFLLDNEINKIKEENHIEDINISQYDLNKDNIKDIIEDANVFSLFADKKMIIVDNSLIFSAKKNDIEQDPKILEEYINNPNENTIIIFNLFDFNPDNKKKIVKLIKTKYMMKDLDYSLNINSMVKDMFKGYYINNNVIDLMIKKVGKNLAILSNEANKIMIYKDKNLEITEDDIENICIDNSDDNIFDLVEYIMNKDIEKALKLYHRLLSYNMEPIALVTMLANKIRSIYQVKELYKLGHDDDTYICSLLDKKPGELYYIKKSIKKYEEEELLKNLEKLADIDFIIKTDYSKKDTALEYYIIGL